MGILKSAARKLGTSAARFAKKRITGALDSASDALERLVFGEGGQPAGDDARRADESEKPDKPEQPEDPFAKLKEKERRESGKVR